MRYYHYTSSSAFSSILQNAPIKDKEICFWATRYDCFVDKIEYIHGIEKLRPVLEAFEKRSGLTRERQVSQLFNPKEIEKSLGLPVPYVISISARKDNEYMWNNYADNGHVVVLELDFINPSGFYEASLYSIESCIYDSYATFDEIYKIVNDQYYDMATRMVFGNPDLALLLLKDNPTVFVKFIAMYLLAFIAPRFKRDDFMNEEEIRIIISSPKKEYNTLFNGITYPNQFQSLIDKVQNFVAAEKQRMDNGKSYREIFMPISVLKRIWIKDASQKEKIEIILSKKGYSHIPVETVD